METIRVIFGRNDTWRSKVIRFHSWSDWSHVGAIVDGYVIESKGRIGVVKTPLHIFKKKYTHTLEANMLVISKERALALLQDALDKKIPYDRNAIYGIVFRTGNQDAHGEQCAEFMARVSGVIRRSKWFRISPEEILSICLEEDTSYLDIHEFFPT